MLFLYALQDPIVISLESPYSHIAKFKCKFGYTKWNVNCSYLRGRMTKEVKDRIRHKCLEAFEIITNIVIDTIVIAVALGSFWFIDVILDITGNESEFLVKIMHNLTDPIVILTLSAISINNIILIPRSMKTSQKPKPKLELIKQ